MSNVSFLSYSNLCGIYEVDTGGTIFYHRSIANNLTPNSAIDLVGRNFFDELAELRNLNELRGHFKYFLTAPSSSEEFSINFNFPEQTLASRMKLTKIRQRENNQTNRLIIVDIRLI